MVRRSYVVFAAIAAALLGVFGVPALLRGSGPPATDAGLPGDTPVVETVAAETQPMTRTVRLAGSLKSGGEATLSPRVGGRVAAVFVREGQPVRRGQVLLRLEDADLRRHVEQARAGVAAARAQLEKALTGERLRRDAVETRIREARAGVEQARLAAEKADAGIGLQTRASQADVERAQAGVDAAKSALAQARRGVRPEQRRQAALQVRAAARGAAIARRSLDDLEFLHSKGGASRMQVEQARESYQKAQDAQEQAQSQLDILEAGASPEEIASAEAQVRSAEAALLAARTAAGREEVDRSDRAAVGARQRQAEDALATAVAARAEIELSRGDVRAARAAHQQAIAAAALAVQQLAHVQLTTPIGGLVTDVYVHPGEMAAPGQPAVRIVSTSGIYLEAVAPARLLKDIEPRHRAAVSVEALPGRVFPGLVRSVELTAAPDGRSFPVHIEVYAGAGVIRPGGLANARVIVAHYPEALTVPLETLRTDGGRTFIWLVRDGRLAEVVVAIPVQDANRAMIRGDVVPGERVVVSAPSGISPGDPVAVRPAETPH